MNSNGLLGGRTGVKSWNRHGRHERQVQPAQPAPVLPPKFIKLREYYEAVAMGAQPTEEWIVWAALTREDYDRWRARYGYSQ